MHAAATPVYGSKERQVLTDTQCTSTNDEDARRPRDPLLEALQPCDSALLRPARDVEHARLLRVFVRDGLQEADGRRETAAVIIQEVVDTQRAVVLGDSMLRESLVERAAGNKRELRYTTMPPL